MMWKGNELSDFIMIYVQELLTVCRNINGFYSTFSQDRVTQWSENQVLSFIQLGITKLFHW